MEKVFASWSGGKDGCLAAYRAIAEGLKVAYLANTVTEDGIRSCSHGISANWIELQAQAMGIPIIQQPTTNNTYEAEFKKMALALKEKGISGGVFGDIDFEPHREWVQRVCAGVGMNAYLPLWGDSQNKIISEFIDAEFEAVIVATKADLMGEEWLGRTIDRQFIADLAKLSETKPITPCGEAGEYHSLVIDGPLFKKRVEILKTTRILREDHWFLEITGAKLGRK